MKRGNGLEKVVKVMRR